jgi:hypothetical protein
MDDVEHAPSGENPSKKTKMVGSKVAAVFRSEMTKLIVGVIELGMRTSQDSVGRVDGKRSSRHCEHCRWSAWLSTSPLG